MTGKTASHFKIIQIFQKVSIVTSHILSTPTQLHLHFGTEATFLLLWMLFSKIHQNCKYSFRFKTRTMNLKYLAANPCYEVYPSLHDVFGTLFQHCSSGIFQQNYMNTDLNSDFCQLWVVQNIYVSITLQVTLDKYMVIMPHEHSRQAMDTKHKAVELACYF